jgi:hypothetical protein
VRRLGSCCRATGARAEQRGAQQPHSRRLALGGATVNSIVFMRAGIATPRVSLPSRQCSALARRSPGAAALDEAGLLERVDDLVIVPLIISSARRCGSRGSAPGAIQAGGRRAERSSGVEPLAAVRCATDGSSDPLGAPAAAAGTARCSQALLAEARRWRADRAPVKPLSLSGCPGHAGKRARGALGQLERVRRRSSGFGCATGRRAQTSIRPPSASVDTEQVGERCCDASPALVEDGEDPSRAGAAAGQTLRPTSIAPQVRVARSAEVRGGTRVAHGINS